jgi:hypothetical protein
MPSMPKITIPAVPDNVRQAMTMAFLTMAAGAAANVGHDAIQSAQDRLTRGRDLRKMMSVVPELAERGTPEEIALVFGSVRQLSPQVTKNPLLAGAIVSQILSSRHGVGPSMKGTPKMDLNMAQNLARMSSDVGSPPKYVNDAATSALAGFAASRDLAARREDAAMTRDSARSLEELKAKFSAKNSKAQQRRQHANAVSLELLKDSLRPPRNP